MLLPIQALLARLTSATGIDFTLISPDTIELSAGDAFKLAAVVDLAQNPEPPKTREEIMHERVFGPVCALVHDVQAPTRVDLKLKPWVLISEPGAHVKRYAQPDDTVMGQPREQVAKDLAEVRAMAEQAKLAEAGRKSWATRRANASKKAGRK